jgi:hypothetical protein
MSDEKGRAGFTLGNIQATAAMVKKLGLCSRSATRRACSPAPSAGRGACRERRRRRAQATRTWRARRTWQDGARARASGRTSDSRRPPRRAPTTTASSTGGTPIERRTRRAPTPSPPLTPPGLPRSGRGASGFYSGTGSKRSLMRTGSAVPGCEGSRSTSRPGHGARPDPSPPEALDDGRDVEHGSHLAESRLNRERFGAGVIG